MCYKNPPYKRMTLNLNQQVGLAIDIASGKKLKDLAKEYGWSYSKLLMNKKLLGIKKPTNINVNLLLRIPQKHYTHALNRFQKIIDEEYRIEDSVKNLLK